MTETTSTFSVILYALLPVFGHVLGALLAECIKPPRWIVGVALHCAGGIALALISIEFMPRILESVPIVWQILAFVVGGLLSIGAAGAVKLLQGPLGSRGTGALAAYGAISIDLISDGLMTGAGAAVASRLGLLLAAAQAIANIPGGFAVTASLRHQDVRRYKRLGMACSVAVPVITAAVIGLVVLRGQPAILQNSILMVISGLLMLATVEDVIPEGDAPRPPRWLSTAAFTLGFIGLALSSHFS